jgi:hypothetical protein
MPNIYQVCATLILAILAVTATAQSKEFANQNDAIAAIPSGDGWVWTQDAGDLNGDGLKDVAMILTHNGLERISLVVLAGLPGERYSVLSVSRKYCTAQKFFNLTIDKGSLFAQAVNAADSSHIGSTTLQFRFNPKINDLELIGQEDVSESYEDGEYYRHSINHVNGAWKIYQRESGGRSKPIKSGVFKVLPLHRLNGFDCDSLER